MAKPVLPRGGPLAFDAHSEMTGKYPKGIKTGKQDFPDILLLPDGFPTASMANGSTISLRK